MRTMAAASLLALVTTFTVGAAAMDPTAGPPKPGKKCSVAAEGVGADDGPGALGPGGWGVAAVVGAALLVSRRRRSS